MRMWMVDPRCMCRKHLLGEHVEIHMLVGSLVRGKSIKGFLDKGLLAPQEIFNRHAALVEEMVRRGYNHKSDLPEMDLSIYPVGHVDIEKSYRELYGRCEKCRRR